MTTSFNLPFRRRSDLNHLGSGRGGDVARNFSASLSQRAGGGQPIVLASTRRSGDTRPEVSVPKRLPTGVAAHGTDDGSFSSSSSLIQRGVRDLL